MSQHTKKAGRLIAVALAIVVSAGSVIAHHSFTAEFDPNKRIELHGKITSMRWANPHAWIYIDVEAEGKVVNWALETGPANTLLRRGWRPEDLPVGTEVTVDGWQARNGSPTANITSITFLDGRRLFAGSSNPEAQEPTQ